jgi:hypothetical protein
MIRKNIFTIVILAATLLFMFCVKEPIRNGAPVTLSSIPQIEMPDSNVWEQSGAADDAFLSSPKTFTHGSNHFSGTLSLKDMMPKQHSDINDDEHPSAEAEDSKDSEHLANHWPKNLLLDTSPTPKEPLQSAAGEESDVDPRTPLKANT